MISFSHRAAQVRPTTRDVRLEQGRRGFAVTVDITHHAAVHEAMTRLKDEGVHSVDLLINNIELDNPEVEVLGSHPDQWMSIVGEYLRTTQLLVHELGPGMIQRGKGRIVSLIGQATSRSRPAREAHSIGRSELMNLNCVLAQQLAGTGVLVFQLVSPGEPKAAPPKFDQPCAPQSAWPDPEEAIALVNAIATGELDQWAGESITAAPAQISGLRSSMAKDDVFVLPSHRSKEDSS